ncbi:MAG: quinohemoprotein amine dehydrogenase maturation protein [Dechloromonas sp.]|uniref:quinohemoprotein amine dehydrogenase maturation protein n=1 Tax=Dechloromonas sp. TaxID=1917218 RepID=UPI0027F3C36C|nr:quinohemoprotein amine dehydrogenase maturation protein [Dechloromonas sp.]MBT9519992.1 quinohemoprotein amine dehydrogenase maturation protein [Dechloromonas sp.]
MGEVNSLLVDDHAFHDITFKGKRVLLHIPSTGIFVLDSVAGKLLDYVKSKELTSQLDIRHHLMGHPLDEISNALDDFQALGILNDISTAIKHTGANNNIKVTEFPLSTIVLNVNTGCNLSCTYCYKEDLATPSDGKLLELEKAKEGIELLIREGKNRKSLNVVFFGGEPLSNMKLIRAVTTYAEQRCAEENKNVDFSLTTNATLLTDELIDYFNEHKFGISISMDGPEAVHDRRRRTVGGFGTHGVVAKKAKNLVSRYTAKPVGARVTVTSGFTDVRAIHDHLKNEIGFAEVGIAPVTSNPIADFNLSNDELRKLFESMKDLGRDYVAAAIRGENNGFSNMHQMMSDLYEGRKKSLPCGAGVGLLAVDHKGDLNLCHRFTGSELPTFGNVSTGIKKAELGAFIEKAIDRNDRGCATCRIRNLCSGGCYHESYANFSDPHSPVYHYCELLREWVDFGIECYLEIVEKNINFLHEHVSNRRGEQ